MNLQKLGHLLFLTEGRIDRKTWWISNIIIWLLMAITTGLYHKYGLHVAAFGMVFVILDWWLHVNINIKRLRDHGRTGWGLFVRIFLSEVPVIGHIYGFVVFGCLKGTDDSASA